MAEASTLRRLGFGAAVVVVIVAIAVTVVIGIVRSSAVPVESVAITASSAPSIQAAPLAVHVAGRVRSPGLYLLEPGSRVVDAIAAAGGFADDAEQSGVNLARALSDGEQVMVPAIGEAPVAAPNGPGAASDVINLNQADTTALETLPRIGPALAARIVDWRDQNGAFTSVDDLLAVPGIGEKLLEGVRERVTV